MSGFKKGQLKAEFAATGIGFAGEEAQPELNNTAIAKELSTNTDNRADPQQATQKASLATQTEIELNTARKEGGAHSIGRIETALDQREKHSTEKQRKRDKKFSDYIQRLEQQRQDLQRQLEWLIHYFEQKAQEAKEEADELRQKVADNYEQMGKNSDFIGAVDKLLKAHERGNPFDKEKLRNLLKEQGAKIDDSTPLAILLQTAEEMIIKADDSNKHLEIDAGIYEKEIDKYDQKFEEYSNKAKELNTELDDLKAQSFSDEEYTKRAERILKSVPTEVRREYEKNYGSKTLNKQAEKAIQTKESEAKAFDAFSMMDDPIEDNVEEPQKISISPTPSLGM